METAAEIIESYFKSINSEPIREIEKLPKSGGDRIYFRIITQNKSYIATYNENLKESNTFLYFTQHFAQIKAPVPEIYFVSDDAKMYIQQENKFIILNITII